MKKILSVLFAISFCKGFGQIPFNATYHDKIEHARNMASVNQDYYCLTSNGSPQQFGEPQLYRYNKNGALVFRKPFHIGALTTTFMFPALDDKLIVAGNMFTCDVPDSSKMRSFISKIDTSGNTIFTYTVKLFYSNSVFDRFRAVVQSADSSFYAFTDSLMFKVSKSGQLLERKNLGVKSISSVLLLPNGNLLLSCNANNQNCFYEIDGSGVFLIVTPAAALYRKMFRFSNGSFCALGNQSFQKYSATYQAVQSFTTVFNDACVYKDTVYMISSDANQIKYEVADSTFNVIHSFQDYTGNSFGRAISCSNGFTAILSACKSDPAMQTSFFASLNVFPHLSSYNYSRDIGVCLLVLDSVYSYATQQGMAPYLFTAGYKKATAYVKNYGSVPVSLFNLNFFQSQHVACGQKFYQQLCNSAPLNPGDSVAILTPSFVSSKYEAGTSFTYQFCFFTTTPDFKNDTVIQNDGKCVAVTVQANGIAENSLLDIKLYPNPVEGKLSLQFDGVEAVTVSVFDAMGKVYSLPVQNETNGLQLDASDLAEGIYFMIISKESVTMKTFKFIKVK